MDETSADQNEKMAFFAQATDQMDVIAHRGGNGQWPGETTYAFERAVESGADVLEMDVWGTSDDPPVLVLMHSPDTSKTTDGTKKLPFCKFADLVGLNAAYRWSPDGGKSFPFSHTESVIPIAKLEDVLEKFRDRRMNIEIKQKRPSIVKPFIKAILDSEVPAKNLLIASLHTRVLKEFRKECADRKLEIATSASTWEWLKFYFGNYLLHLSYKPPAQAIQMAERLPVVRLWLLSRSFVERVHLAKLKVHAWTVDDPRDMQRAIVNGVDGIITDFPGPLRAILDEPDGDRSLPRDKGGPTTSSLLNRWSRFRNNLTGFFSILKVVRFSLAMAVLPAIALIFVEQGREALRILATSGNHPTSVSAFVLALTLLMLTAWYWASILVDVLRPGARIEGGFKGWAARQLPRICGIIPSLALAVAMIAAYEPFKSFPQPAEPKSAAVTYDAAVTQSLALTDQRPPVEVVNTRYRFFVFAVMCVAFTVPVYGFFYFRRRRLENYYRKQKRQNWRLGNPVPDDHPEEQQIPIKHLPRTSKAILAITLLIWLGLLVVFLMQTGNRPVTITTAQEIGPMAILMLFAAVWVPVGSLLVFWADTFRVPLLTILVLLAGTFSLLDINDNHQIRNIRSMAAPSLPVVKNAFDEWLNNRCDRNPSTPYPVFIVSAEGGGLRTAYFTSLVLSAAQDRDPAFAHHVFAISGVSGGSVGASVFAALADKYVHARTGTPCTFTNDLPNKPDGSRQTMQDMTNEVLGQDLLSPVLAGAVYPDLIQRFVPWRVDRFDRARYLEDGLAQAWQNATQTREFSNQYSFYSLADNFARKSTPALFLNTTKVETGERMVVSSLDLWGTDGQADQNLSGLLGINHIPNIDAPNLPLSTAAFLSARFPFITPPGSIGSGPAKTRYVDGGYFEISGTATLIDLISALSSDLINPTVSDKAQPSAQTVKLIVINIGTDPVDMKYDYPGIGELTGPIVALLNTRSARGDTATNQLETVISKLNSIRGETNQNALAEVVHFQAYQVDKRLPTGWLLSDRARQNMECQLGVSAEKNGNDQCSITNYERRSNVRHCECDRTCLKEIANLLRN